MRFKQNSEVGFRWTAIASGYTSKGNIKISVQCSTEIIYMYCIREVVVLLCFSYTDTNKGSTRDLFFHTTVYSEIF